MSEPLIVHIIHRLQVGGLENGLVNLINHMPTERYRHAIVCMTESTEFRTRIRRSDVEVFELHKKPGHDLGLYWRLWKLLRQLRPAIVHTRNIGTLECQAIAMFAGVKARVHGEHGRDMSDLHGRNVRYIRFRRIMKSFLSHTIAVSQDLFAWLIDTIGARRDSVTQIYNGVDMEKFQPRAAQARDVLPAGFAGPDAVVVGTVGRLSGEKDQATLVRAFVDATIQASGVPLRLVLIGDGPLRGDLENLIRDSGVIDQVWMAGNRKDVPDLLRALDIFVLPSLGEGISNTILEAMACGVPVVATRVGGNPELVHDGRTGYLVAPANPTQMARAITHYATHQNDARAHGAAGRERVVRDFSMDNMVARYMAVYDAARNIPQTAGTGVS